jgi:hypothetical protein
VTKRIFDQHRPRSTMAQRLDEAFAGCEEWTVVAAPRRRSTLEVAPWVAPAESSRSEEERLPRAA